MLRLKAYVNSRERILFKKLVTFNLNLTGWVWSKMYTMKQLFLFYIVLKDLMFRMLKCFLHTTYLFLKQLWI